MVVFFEGSAAITSASVNDSLKMKEFKGFEVLSLFEA